MSIEPRPEILSAPEAVHGGPRGSRDRRSPVRLDFSASLNAWGPAPEVLAAVRAAPVDGYPDPECLAPRLAAAERWGRAAEEIAFGAGAAELLHALCFAFLRSGDRVVVPAPGFGEYARSAALCGAAVEEIRARGASLQLDAAELADAIRRLRPRLAFLCAPNNPTGQAFSGEEVRRVADACAGAGALLVLDQSYDAFLERPLGTPALPGHPAAIAVRSITKDHALAGVRAAFAVGPAAVIGALERARIPWAASSAAQAAAVAALSEAGDAHLRATLPRLRAERERLEGELRRLGIPSVPTAAHFLLMEVGDAARLTGALRERHGIAVRDCASFGLQRHVRIAARTPAENDALLLALEAECSR
jgi:histidinol-phosphate aminotransferase